MISNVHLFSPFSICASSGLFFLPPSDEDEGPYLTALLREQEKDPSRKGSDR